MRLIKMAIVTGLLSLSCFAQANAQGVPPTVPTWFQVSVNFAGGTDTGRIYVNVTDVSCADIGGSCPFSESWCLNDSLTHTKMVLAGALASVAAKSQNTFALLSDPTGLCIVHAVLAGEGL